MKKFWMFAIAVIALISAVACAVALRSNHFRLANLQQRSKEKDDSRARSYSSLSCPSSTISQRRSTSTPFACKKCKKKDERIAELEAQVELMKGLKEFAREKVSDRELKNYKDIIRSLQEENHKFKEIIQMYMKPNADASMAALEAEDKKVSAKLDREANRLARNQVYLKELQNQNKHLINETSFKELQNQNLVNENETSFRELESHDLANECEASVLVNDAVSEDVQTEKLVHEYKQNERDSMLVDALQEFGFVT